MTDSGPDSTKSATMPLTREEEYLRKANADRPAGMQLMNGRYAAADERNNTVTIAFELDGRFCNSFNKITGGYVANMLDHAAAASVTFATGRRTPSIELKVNFLSAAPPGKFYAVGKCIKAGKHIATTAAKLYDEADKLIAISQSTQHVYTPD